MFTLDQINEVHDRIRGIADFPAYVIGLNSLGIDKYESFLTDGHSEYYGKDGFRLSSTPVHDVHAISDISDKEKFLAALDTHRRGDTDYFEMSKSLADSGVEKWIVDTNKMTITYVNKRNEVLLSEAVR